MEEKDLSDVWRTLNAGVRQYSWTRFHPAFVGSRLDFILLEQSLVNKIMEIDYIPMVLTDHAVVTATFNFAEHP